MKGFLVECKNKDDYRFICFFHDLKFVKWYVDFEKKHTKSEISVYKVDINKLEKVDL